MNKNELKNFAWKNMNTRILAYLALFIAFVAVATYIYIPGPASSYFNLGEVAIYIIALTFGARAGGIAGGLGSSLVDILLGYSIWAPFTLVIKGVEGYVVGKIAGQSKKGNSFKRDLVAILIGGHIMIIGYAITKGFLLSWAVIFPEIGIDYAQMIIGGSVAVPIARQLNKNL